MLKAIKYPSRGEAGSKQSKIQLHDAIRLDHMNISFPNEPRTILRRIKTKQIGDVQSKRIICAVKKT